jgi:anti-anti-sigma factor
VDVKGAHASLWDGHIVLLYRSEREHDASLRTWIRRGLDRGDKVVLTRLPGDPADPVLRLWADVGVTPAQERRVGQLVSLPPTAFYSPRGQDELITRAFAEGFPGVRLSAQAATALSIMSERDYQAAERAMDRNCRDGSVSAMCAYRRPAPTEPALRQTLATHSEGVRAVGFSSSRGEDGVRLRGEVDLVTRDVLAAALDAAVGTMVSADDLVLDLSGLGFIDLAGARMLLRATADFRAAGGRLVLTRIQRPVARALRLLDIDRAPGVRLGDEGS